MKRVHRKLCYFNNLTSIIRVNIGLLVVASVVFVIVAWTTLEVMVGPTSFCPVAVPSWSQRWITGQNAVGPTTDSNVVPTDVQRLGQRRTDVC